MQNSGIYTSEFYQWRDNIVSALLGLADKRYQCMAWSGAIASADGSPDEMINTLWDDLSFENFITQYHEALTATQMEKSKALIAAINLYADKEPDFSEDIERVFLSNAWIRVIETSKELYLAFCPNDYIESETDIKIPQIKGPG